MDEANIDPATVPGPVDELSSSSDAAPSATSDAGPTVDEDGTVRSSSGAIMKAIEVWAQEKSMLPQFLDGDVARVPASALAPGQRTVAVALGGLRGPRTNPNFRRFAAARALRGWPESKEVTEADFDAAVTDAENHVCR